MNAKQLHKHAIPIVILCVGLCAVSVIIIGRLLVESTQSGNVFTQLITERNLSVKPTSNGWFQASRYQPEDQAASNLSLGNQASANNGLSMIDDTGQNSTLDATLAH